MEGGKDQVACQKGSETRHGKEEHGAWCYRESDPCHRQPPEVPQWRSFLPGEGRRGASNRHCVFPSLMYMYLSRHVCTVL